MVIGFSRSGFLQMSHFYIESDSYTLLHPTVGSFFLSFSNWEKHGRFGVRFLGITDCETRCKKLVNWVWSIAWKLTVQFPEVVRLTLVRRLKALGDVLSRWRFGGM